MRFGDAQFFGIACCLIRVHDATACNSYVLNENQCEVCNKYSYFTHVSYRGMFRFQSHRRRADARIAVQGYSQLTIFFILTTKVGLCRGTPIYLNGISITHCI